jgi:hypothetical protein
MDSSYPEYHLAGKALESMEDLEMPRPGSFRAETEASLYLSTEPFGWRAAKVSVGKAAIELARNFVRREQRSYSWDVYERSEELDSIEVPSLESSVKSIRAEIERAGKVEDDRCALVELEKIWRQVEELSSRTEAQFRLRLNTSGPVMTDAPEWLSSQVEQLKANRGGRLHPPHPVALQSAERLVRAVQHKLNGHIELRAELAPAPLGRVEIRWAGERVLRWIVGAAALPWPGVTVRVYEEANPESLELKATTFHLADDVVSHARKVLTTDHDEGELP